MGLEILDEFRPIMPIRTVPVPKVRTFSQGSELVEASAKEEMLVQECHTPTSSSKVAQTLLVCPPPPKKPRVSRRTSHSHSQAGFFQVPHDDLASVFLLRTKPSVPRKLFAS
ncbi:hypothetical protein AAZX31_17G055500 [Glycine max]|uniref:Uncharacterized protein n=2 Tax=Glycine subgen. Soja TaxID=1462606 RepID=K7MK39_SOYBN|nr:hypothetical protein JHK86_046584 [Glycine max]KHN17650.1 hypothetical protein glysoja_005847 [Glycine soja]KAG4942495.1 hypothetical protein JHK85_047141 [Glycine max]KAG5096837.1 hypothetical protein JHK82_046691 [Glycine max]KAG5101622.1 hypothetical protein JHK84_046591 [Glycine max]